MYAHLDIWAGADHKEKHSGMSQNMSGTICLLSAVTFGRSDPCAPSKQIHPGTVSRTWDISGGSCRNLHKTTKVNNQ